MIEEIDELLIAWAREYGSRDDSRLGWPGRSSIQTAIDHHGFSPSSAGFIPIPIRTKSDEIEAIVRGMENGHYRKHAIILRCDYFNPGCALDQRLDSMRRSGYAMSKAGYYDNLAVAKAYVDGAYRARTMRDRVA